MIIFSTVKGVTYFGCTSVDDPNGQVWCSTKTAQETRKHISGSGFWGICPDQSCENPICLLGESQSKTNDLLIYIFHLNKLKRNYRVRHILWPGNKGLFFRSALL